jgi:hypothetical protein
MMKNNEVLMMILNIYDQLSTFHIWLLDLFTALF